RGPGAPRRCPPPCATTSRTFARATPPPGVLQVARQGHWAAPSPPPRCHPQWIAPLHLTTKTLHSKNEYLNGNNAVQPPLATPAPAPVALRHAPSSASTERRHGASACQ